MGSGGGSQSQALKQLLQEGLYKHATYYAAAGNK